jgi:hypothetical protein
MHSRVLGCGVVLAIAALVGCGSSGGTGGNTGKGGSTGAAGSTGSGGRAGGTGSGGSTGSGNTSGTFTTSVPSGTKLTGLTSGQVTQLCTDIANFARAEEPTVCNAEAPFNGLFAADFDLLVNPNATDAELRADCTSASADGGTCSSNGTCNIASIPSSCQATVADYTTCLNQAITAELQYFAAFPSCSSITAASLNALFAADGGASASPMESATCAMFDSTCSVVDDSGTAAMTNMSPFPLASHRRR